MNEPPKTEITYDEWPASAFMYQLKDQSVPVVEEVWNASMDYVYRETPDVADYSDAHIMRFANSEGPYPI